LVGNPEDKRPLGRQYADGMIILGCNFGKESGKVWIGFIRLR